MKVDICEIVFWAVMNAFMTLFAIVAISQQYHRIGFALLFFVFFKFPTGRAQ